MATLYTYFRSSCSYRVRIALALKGLECDFHYVNLKPGENEQKSDDYLALNPQGKVPLFVDGKCKISQSTAIIEYLEHRYPETPLLPEESLARAHVREFANIIACDIQPLNNLGTLNSLRSIFKASDEQVERWYCQWIQEGFGALEYLLETNPATGPFCFGERATLADVYLIPQVWNAIRFEVPLQGFPLINAIYEHANQQEAFKIASPEMQIDNPLREK